MSEEHDEVQRGEQHPIIKLKPTQFDRVLDGIAGLILLTMWGMAIVQLLCSEHWYDLFIFFLHTVLITWLAVWFYRKRPYPPQINRRYFFVKITDENAERQFRLDAMLQRLLLITIGLYFISIKVIRLWPLESRDPLRDAVAIIYLGLLLCISICYSIRAWQLR